VLAYIGTIPVALARAHKNWKAREEYDLYTAANTDPAGNIAASAVAIQQVPNSNGEQPPAGTKAAHALMEFDKRTQGVADAAWVQAQDQLPAADAAYNKALEATPDSSFIGCELAKAIRCRARPQSTRRCAIPRAM